MFGQIAPTEFDLRFSVFRIPVRVHPVFWLTSAFLAWDRSGDPDLWRILLRILSIFIAILVHELGHAVVTRFYGWNPEIVLYFFGGYATSMRHSTWKDIAVSASGPGAGLLLFTVILFGAPGLIARGWLDNELVIDALEFSLFINLAWSLANLIPVLPLDGGRICEELCHWLSPRHGTKISLQFSMLTGGGVALYALRAKTLNEPVLGLDPLFLAIMFGYLAFQSYQQLQSYRGRW